MNENIKEDGYIDLTQYIERFCRSFAKLYKMVLVLVVLLGVGNVAKTWVTFNTTYTARMTVIVAGKNQSLLETNEASGEMTDAFQRALSSNMMANIICTDLNVSSLPASMNVNRISDTNLMTIASTSRDALSAYDVLKSVTTNYGQLTKLMDGEATMVIVEEPELPTLPDSTPQYMKKGIVGAVGGLILGLGLVLLHSLFSKTITKETQIKQLLRLNALGTIPCISKKKASYQTKQSYLITNNRLPSAFKESFNLLRMSIEKEKENKGNKVFMFTSVLPNEGKSTVATNVAIALANTGKKVLLVDFDLRNPTIAKILNLKNYAGEVGGFLEGKVYLSEVLKKHPEIPNLHLMLGTVSHHNSVELLSREGLKKMMDKIKEHYDYVFIDVPPLDTMQDACLVANLSDAAVLVVRQDYAKVNEIYDALEELQDACKNIMGCVLNQVKYSIFDEQSRGYGYGYGYGYGRKN